MLPSAFILKEDYLMTYKFRFILTKIIVFSHFFYLITQKSLKSSDSRLIYFRYILFLMEEKLSILQFALLQTLGVLGYNQVVDAVLNVTIHKGRKIVDGVVYTVVGDAALRIVVGTNLRRAVTC